MKCNNCSSPLEMIQDKNRPWFIPFVSLERFPYSNNYKDRATPKRYKEVFIPEFQWLNINVSKKIRDIILRKDSCYVLLSLSDILAFR